MLHNLEDKINKSEHRDEVQSGSSQSLLSVSLIFFFFFCPAQSERLHEFTSLVWFHILWLGRQCVFIQVSAALFNEGKAKESQTQHLQTD